MTSSLYLRNLGVPSFQFATKSDFPVYMLKPSGPLFIRVAVLVILAPVWVFISYFIGTTLRSIAACEYDIRWKYTKNNADIKMKKRFITDKIY